MEAFVTAIIIDDASSSSPTMWAGVTAHNHELKPPARSSLKVDYGWSLSALIPTYSAVLEATSIRIAKC